MRWRPLIWAGISLLCFAGAIHFWKLGNRWERQRREDAAAAKAAMTVKPAAQGKHQQALVPAGFGLLSQPGTLNAPAVAKPGESPMAKAKAQHLKHRITNTTKPLGELVREPGAILLENALLDTDAPMGLNIPEKLRSKGDPGAYIVQSRGPLDEAFRALLRNSGATIISYIPNNAYLVRGSEQMAAKLRGDARTRSVLAYEPFYKLKGELLKAAIEGEPADQLNVLVFEDARDAATAGLRDLGLEVYGQERSPFGTVLKVRAQGQPLDQITALAGVQQVEISRERVRANDLSRVAVGLAAIPTAATNYLNLSGTNVIVNINDTGVDTNHPDLQGRVLLDLPISGVDSNGHGTHVAAVIAGSGAASDTVTNAVSGQFRGKAPAARLFSMLADLRWGPASSDAYLQERAATTNALISNNSWHYFGANQYDLAAASYDAAVRDAVPGITGPQSLLFVFAAGNVGNGGDDPLSGSPETVLSPATSKNGITVGALEQFRNITNEVYKCSTYNDGTNTTTDCSTNSPWAATTDSNNEVAGFSSRGNIGIGVEGEAGRFKPDVVAPGTFVASARSTCWDTAAYYDPTNYHYATIVDEIVETNAFNVYTVFVPDNAVAVNIRVQATRPVVDLPVYVRAGDNPTLADVAGTNNVWLPPDKPLSPVGTIYYYAVTNTTREPIVFTTWTTVLTTNDNGNYLDVLRGINDSLGGSYRYESGTSMAAGETSGLLALMHDFFLRGLRTNSPALMKALLINGARSVGPNYDLQIDAPVNHQGWGQINITNSLPLGISNGVPGVKASLLYFEQEVTNALATGQSRTYRVSVSPKGQEQPLRATLVWTDPPGNPAASVKLVNNLDLIITNLDSGEIFFGNTFGYGENFSLPWDTNTPARADVVNNVENIYLLPKLGTNYSVTVIGRSVNVNAVTGQSNLVAQDYALVISSGNGQQKDALSVVPGEVVSAPVDRVTSITNSFTGSTTVSGSMLSNQRVGANPALADGNKLALTDNQGMVTLGYTNQWRFYVLSNDLNFTNAAFVTFTPPNLSVPRKGVDEPSIDDATRIEADIDMYVSMNPGLTNLDPVVLASADKALKRSGTELVVYSNAVAGGVYYVGVKAEDQQAAEFTFFGAFSLEPFGQQDENGDWIIRGITVPATIPDGNPPAPGAVQIVAIAPMPVQVRRVIVTNTIVHEEFGDLLGNLSHGQKYAVLNNHSFAPGTPPPLTYTFIYEDNEEGDIIGSRRTDGPGSLRDFVGEPGEGVWLLTMVDNALSQTGRVDDLRIKIERQNPDTNGIAGEVMPQSWKYYFVDVPIEATNLTVCLNNTSDTMLPLNLYVRRGAFPTFADYDRRLTVYPPGDCLSIGVADLPPIAPGRYFIGIFNPNGITQKFRLIWTLDLDLAAIKPIKWGSTPGVPILDDAISYDSVFVTNHQKIASVEVGLRVDHPRISDMVFHLISPQGKRVLLFENRGGNTTAGMGGGLLTTNVLPATSSGDYNAATNVIAVGQNWGTLQIDYDFLQLPDDLRVYYDGKAIFDSGMVTGVGRWTVPFGPGTNTDLMVIVNENGNGDTNTVWTYTAAVISGDFTYFTLTEDTNKTTIPVKFATPPFASTNSTTNYLISGFEGGAGDYPALSSFEGWSVISNQASVMVDPTVAHSGSGYLSLANSRLTRTLPTIKGRKYGLSYAYRGPGIVGLWRGENNGVDSIQGFNATTMQSITFTNGTVGQAFAVGGVSPRILIPDRPAFYLTNSLSIDSWIYPQSAGHVIFQRGDNRGGMDPYTLSMQANDYVGFQIVNNNNVGEMIQARVPYGQWTHVAGTLDGYSGTMKLYLNGALAVQTNTAMRPFAALDPQLDPNLGIGNVGDRLNNLPYRGRIDEVSLYGRALSASEIKAIFTAGSAGKFNPTEPMPDALAEAEVAIDGVSTNLVVGQNTSWQVQNLSFTAASDATLLSLSGLQPGVLLDTFEITETGGGLFYFPEESLDVLRGDDPFGEWKLEMWDTRAGATNQATLLGWQLRFIFENTVPRPLALDHGIAQTNTIPPGDIAYFTVDVPPWAQFATNILVYASGPVNLLFNQNTPPTGTNAGDFTLLANSTGGIGNPILSLSSTPVLIPGARYYLGVRNPNTSNVIAAVQVDFDITPLINGVPYPGTMQANLVPRYFSYDVGIDATAVSFQLLNLTGNLDLVARRGAPLPDLVRYHYGSFNRGTNAEDIIVFSDSTPVALSPGVWYLGVFNRDLGTNDYTIVATEYTNAFPAIVTLTNAIPYFGTNSAAAGSTNDYYRFVVGPDAVGVFFDVSQPSADITLVARKGLPLPDLGGYEVISTNSGTGGESIVIYDTSTPVAMSPGNWFITAVNVSGAPVNYTITATELYGYGTNVTIVSTVATTNNLCLAWTSVPGLPYYVQGLTNLGSTNWVTVSLTITATDFLTTWCTPLPSPYYFFRVGQGTAPAGPAQLKVGSITYGPAGVLLRWTGPLGSSYRVQWRAAVAGSPWNTFTNTVTSTDTNFSFLDDGTQTGGLGGVRYYRLEQLP